MQTFTLVERVFQGLCIKNETGHYPQGPNFSGENTNDSSYAHSVCASRVAATRRYKHARARARCCCAASTLMSVALAVSAFGQSAVKQSIVAFMEQWEEAERSLFDDDDDVKLIVV